MSEDHDPELEDLIARNLRALPDQAAPSSLATSVLAALRARQTAPWWRRSWFQWPVSLRVASAFAAVSITSVVVWSAWSHWPDTTARYDAIKESGTTLLAAATAWLGQVSVAAQSHLDTVPSSVWFTALGVIAACYLMCIGLGTAFARYFIFSKQSPRS